VKLGTSIGLGKLPSYRFAGPMAGVVPGSDLVCEGLDVANSPIKALFGKSGSCYLSHIYPTALDWGIVQLKRLGQLESLLRWKSRVKGSWCMCIQVVLYKANTSDQGIIFFDPVLHKQRIVDCGASCPHRHNTPASPGVERQSNTARAMTLIFIILTCRSPRFHGNRSEYIPTELTRPFIKANDRTQRVIWLFVKREHVFHVPNIIPSDFAYAPALDEPRLKFIFLRMVLTVSREIASMAFNSISLSVSNRSVHRAFPAGGVEQANMVTVASSRPSIFDGAPLRTFSCHAFSNPCA
jgi:hypothetical protein